MDWTAHVDGYCERLEPGIWAEPINALTNLAFILGALWVWPRIKGDRGAQVLAVVLFFIGVGSGLFHTFAQGWAAAADVLAIIAYVLAYLYLATLRMIGLSRGFAILAVVLFFPYAIVTSLGVLAIFGPMNGSQSYMPVLFMIAGFAIATRAKPKLSRGLWISVALLTLSIFLRSIDEAICASLPIGTHFLWHIINGIMLTHMVLVMARHAPPPLARAPEQG